MLVLDGAWATTLQRLGLGPADYRGELLNDHPRDVTGDPDLLNLTRPDIVLQVHRGFLAAGADIFTTNTRARREWYEPDAAPSIEDLHAERIRRIRPA